MVRKLNNYFVLETEHTTYCFRVMPTGHLEHLYYGRKISLPDEKSMEALIEKKAFASGNTNYYDEENKSFSLEDTRLEASAYGRSDIREPLIEVIHGDGSFTSDFVFERVTMKKEKADFGSLPGSYDESGKATQRERELKAADRIFSLLPKEQGQKLRALWDEFEERETAEAKFARTMDNIQPMMLNDASDGLAWREHEVKLSQILKRNERTAEGSEALWEYAKENFIEPHVRKGDIL